MADTWNINNADGTGNRLQAIIAAPPSATASTQLCLDSSKNVTTAASAPIIGGTIGTSLNSAPADAALSAGQAAIWLDATNGAGKLMVKAKTANGTVATAAINLT